MEQTVVDKFRTAVERGPKVLLVDDMSLIAETLTTIIRTLIPSAVVHCMKVEEYEGEVMTVIRSVAPHIVVLDGDLGPWRHPQFHSFAMNLIEPIKKIYPEAFIIAASLKASNNQQGMEKGADAQVRKDNFDKFLKTLLTAAGIDLHQKN